MQVYFINSKRRFFLYFRSHAQMLEAMRVLADHAVRFYPRQSLLPDREEHEEQVFHCGYRYKKVDLRRNLLPSTPYNEPRLHFDRQDRPRNRQELPPAHSPPKPASADERGAREEAPVESEPQPKAPEEQPVVIGSHRFKNPEAARVIRDRELLNALLFSLNANPPQ